VTPIRTVAVGFDGSSDAQAALRWAIDLAVRIEADVVVIHAVGLLEHAAGRQSGVELEGAVGRIAAEGGIDPARVHWRLTDGDPCSVLARVAPGAPLGGDLLVVGSRGQGAHAGLLLGSTSHELAERAVIPVVIVPARDGTP
jgi:nucleotide-binding universal stress UspA family protein